MNREPLFVLSEHPEFDKILDLVSSGRYFKLLSREILANVLRQGTLVTVKQDQHIIRENSSSPPEMYILVEGSLAILSNNRFILRQNLPGDVVGEMAVIQSAPRSADVVTETDCRLIVFPADLFYVDGDADHASILYVLFAHILAAKLRTTTAQSMIQKNLRVGSQGHVRVGVVDVNVEDRAMISSAVEQSWPEADVTEFASPQDFINSSHSERFDLVIADTESLDDWNSISVFVQSMQVHGAHAVIVGDCCSSAEDRKQLLEIGAAELMTKPCAKVELNHMIRKSRLWHLKNIELDAVEAEAETDGLTGLANRRRLDQFLDALITVYPDSRMPFSLVITDIDNFKDYNDTNGHQMGDIVLREVADALNKEVRRGDLAARFGGEEFLFVLPDCGKDRALELAETLRKTVESLVFRDKENQPLTITMTLGVATYPKDAGDLAGLLKKADDCLYAGKEKGKNIVVGATH